jgi:hypothetical protein
MPEHAALFSHQNDPGRHRGWHFHPRADDASAPAARFRVSLETPGTTASAAALTATGR